MSIIQNFVTQDDSRCNHRAYILIDLAVWILRLTYLHDCEETRGGRIDPYVDSIDTHVGIGIGSILA